MAKNTFACKTFASRTFASGTWTGVGVTPVRPTLPLVTTAADYGRTQARGLDYPATQTTAAGEAS